MKEIIFRCLKILAGVILFWLLILFIKYPVNLNVNGKHYLYEPNYVIRKPAEVKITIPLPELKLAFVRKIPKAQEQIVDSTVCRNDNDCVHEYALQGCCLSITAIGKEHLEEYRQLLNKELIDTQSKCPNRATCPEAETNLAKTAQCGPPDEEGTRRCFLVSAF